MEHCMLYTADIHINRQVLVCLFPGYKLLFIMAVHIAQEIPGGTSPLGHGVGFTFGRRPANRAGGIHPLVNGCQR